MRKRSLKRRAAFILAVLMMFMNCFPTFASEMMDVTDNPEIYETVNDIENINASAGDETTEAVSGVSDDEEEPTEESAEIITSGSIEGSTEESSEIKTDEESVSEDDSTSSEQAESIEEEPEEITPVVSLRATRSLMRLGSVNLLGASNTDTDTVSSGNPAIENGYSWWIEGDTTLCISINKSGAQIATMASNLANNTRTSATASIITTIAFYNNDFNYSFDDGAFRGFSKISNFSIDDKVTKIGKGVFSGCLKLENFTVDDSSIYFSKYEHGLYNKSYTELIAVAAGFDNELIIHENTVSINESAAEGCKISKTLIIPKNVKYIGVKAFKNCNSLEKVTFATVDDRVAGTNLSQIKGIGDEAFAACSSLEYIYIPSTLKNGSGLDNVGSGAFFGNPALKFLFFYGATSTDTDEETLISEYSKLGLNLTDTKGWRCIPFGNYVVTFDPGYGYWGDNPDNSKITVSMIGIGETFNSTYGTIDEPVSKDKNKKFTKWYNLNIGTDSEFNKTSPVTTDYNLKAYYTSYRNVTFQYVNSNGETVILTQFEMVYGTMIRDSQIPDGPTEPIDGIDGARFLGWKCSNAGGGPYSREDITTNTKLFTVMADTEYTAVYSDICKVNFFYRLSGNYVQLVSVNVVKNGKIPNFNQYYEGQYKAIIDAANPPPNNEFKGWFLSGSNSKWGKDELVRSNINLYTEFDEYVFANYYFGDAYCQEYGLTDPKKEKIVNGEYNDLPIIQDLPGYEPGGWYTDKEYKNPIKGSIPITKDTDFYAKFTKKHEVKFYNTKENDYQNHPQIISVVSGDSVAMQLPDSPDDIVENGKSLAFISWNTSSDGSGKDINRGTQINEPMEAYSIWGEGYTVKIYSDEELIRRSVIKHGRTLGSMPKVSKLGYQLLGWNTSPDGTGDSYDEKTKITSSVEIYAVWWDDPNVPNEPQVTVSYNSMGGSVVPDQTLSVNTLITKPADPTWEDHKFVGWFTSPAYENEWDFDHNVITNYMTLYAKWITWTEEDEDNAHSIYWIRMLKGGKAPLTQYFRESGLKFSYDKKIVSVQKKGQVVKGNKVGETLITAYKVDGSEYPVKVRVFVLKQELQNMYAYNTSTILNAPDFLTVSGFLPDRWESSKTSVATIDPKTGIIKVRGRGKSKIKAYYQNKAVTATLYSEVPMFAKKFYIFKTGQSKKIKIKKVKKYDIVSWNIITTPQDDISQNKAGYAEVDNNGVVTAVSAGEVTLEAKVYGQTITTKIHIEPPVLKTRQLEIKINKTKRLKLSRTKLKYVEWKSSNDNVAYVDPTTGKVYAINTGRVTLRTTAGGVTNTCNVIVEDPEASKGSSLRQTANSTLK